MNFGLKAPTLEDQGAASSEEVTQPATAGEPPAGVDQNNVESNPEQTEAEQAASLQTNLEDVDQEVVVTQQPVSDLADYFKAAEQLDSIQAAASEAVIGGGTLSRMSAATIQASLESILRSLKCENVKPLVFPTLEAFSSKWAARDATIVTMEASFEQTIASVLKKIIESLRALFTAASTFLSNLLKNRKLLEMSIRGLMSKINEMKNFAPLEAEITGRFCHGLQVKGHSDISTVFQIASSVEDSMRFFASGVKTIKDIRDGRASLDPIGDIVKAGSYELGQKVTSVTLPGRTERVDLYLALPNGMSVGFVESGDRSKIIYHTNQDGAPSLRSMTAPTASEIRSGLQAALHAITSMQSAERSAPGVMDSIKAILRRVEAGYQEIRGSLGSEEHASKHRLSQDALNTQEVINKMVTRLPSTAFSAIRYISEWAKAGISNLREV